MPAATPCKAYTHIPLGLGTDNTPHTHTPLLPETLAPCRCRTTCPRLACNARLPDLIFVHLEPPLLALRQLGWCLNKVLPEVHTRTHTRTHTCTHARARTHTHAHTHTRTHTHTHTHTRAHTVKPSCALSARFALQLTACARRTVCVCACLRCAGLGWLCCATHWAVGTPFW